MNHLIAVSLNPCSQHVVWSKEEFLTKMSELFDESMNNGCTFFDNLQCELLYIISIVWQHRCLSHSK